MKSNSFHIDSNMLDFILTNMGRNKKKMEDARLGLEGYGS